MSPSRLPCCLETQNARWRDAKNRRPLAILACCARDKIIISLRENKTEVLKCCEPFEYASMWQIEAIGAVIRSKIRSSQIYPETTSDVKQFLSMFLYHLTWIKFNSISNLPSTSVSTHHFKWDDPLGTDENFQPSFLSDSIYVWFYICCCCCTTLYVAYVPLYY